VGGGVCLINICGEGETLLPPKIIEYIQAILEEGHYVSVVTNGTISRRFQEISGFPKDLFQRLFFKFSYHYMELKKRNLLEEFFTNITLMRERGCSFTLEAVPSDELKPYTDEMIALAVEKLGAAPHCTVARDERVAGALPILTAMPKEEYRKTWSVFRSSLFEYKYSIFGVKRKEFCYAGSWSCTINLKTGIMSQCYCSYYKQNVFADPAKPIRFLPVGNNCGKLHCYNGHAFITFGLIPELDAPSYASLRNRLCEDGSEWLSPAMKAFMETKLYDSNTALTPAEKFAVNAEIRVRKLMRLPVRCLHKILRIVFFKK
jgi:hypothetical protein